MLLAFVGQNEVSGNKNDIKRLQACFVVENKQAVGTQPQPQGILLPSSLVSVAYKENIAKKNTWLFTL